MCEKTRRKLLTKNSCYSCGSGRKRWPIPAFSNRYRCFFDLSPTTNNRYLVVSILAPSHRNIRYLMFLCPQLARIDSIDTSSVSCPSLFIARVVKVYTKLDMLLFWTHYLSGRLVLRAIVFEKEIHQRIIKIHV